ncbi:hypothetical protein SH449x_002241 [Pirellulaceae bacterium SH449]
MATVEERLAKVEREIELLRKNRSIDKNWPIAQIDDRFRDDEVLNEIFELAKAERDADRKQNSE